MVVLCGCGGGYGKCSGGCRVETTLGCGSVVATTAAGSTAASAVAVAVAVVTRWVEEADPGMGDNCSSCGCCCGCWEEDSNKEEVLVHGGGACKKPRDSATCASGLFQATEDRCQKK